jgi:hypothetical protein
MAEFKAWPKTPRLFRTIVVTEKIDGTNAGIHVEKITEVYHRWAGDVAHMREHGLLKADEVITSEGHIYRVTAQSRNRLIYPDSDNYGFATWVRANAAELVQVLGEGLHFGEWWGSGIQRRYGLTDGERRFSLFNTDAHKHLRTCVGGVEVAPVPVLYHGEFSEVEIKRWLAALAQHGSIAAPGFDNPEGICVWHSQTRTVFKVTLDNNDAGKWESGA